MITDLQVLAYIVAHDGCTGMEVATALGTPHPLYGKQRSTSVHIVSLRAQGLIEDCARCETCGCAKTRRHRNVPLHATAKGIKRVQDVQSQAA